LIQVEKLTLKNAYLINDFDVVNIGDSETLIFQRREDSHICRHMYSVVLCYLHE